MLDKDEYERAMKKQRKRITTAEIKRKKINCGECIHYREEDHTCDKDWPGVSGKLSARGARVDHNTRTYCGMAGRGFYPKKTQEAVIESEEPKPRGKPGPKPKSLPGQG